MTSLLSSPNLSAIRSWDPATYERLYLGWCLANLRQDFMPQVLSWVDETWFSSVNRANLYTATVEVVLSCIKARGLLASKARVVAAASALSTETSDWAEREVEACISVEQQTMLDLAALEIACVSPWRIVRGKPVVQRSVQQVDDLLTSKQPPEDLPHAVDALLRDASSTWSDCIHGLDRNAEITPQAFMAEALTPLDDTQPLSLASGLRAFDLPLGGGIALENNPICGRLIVIAARPRIGKTALLANICHGIANAGGDLVWYSLEVSSRQVYSRVAAVHDWAMQSPNCSDVVSPAQFNNRSFTEAQRQRLDSYSDSYARGMQVHTNVLGLDQLCSHIQLTKRRNPGLVMAGIDHLGLIKLPKADNNAIAVGMATRALKLLAVELQIDIVLLCQLNRALELRNDPKPMLSDLRDSGRIEEDADVVLGLHRLPDGEHPEHLTVLALKNRHGAVGANQAFFHLRQGVIIDRFAL